MSIGTVVIELCELKEQELFSMQLCFHICCTVITLKVLKLKERTKFPMYGENTKTIDTQYYVLCDILYCIFG